MCFITAGMGGGTGTGAAQLPGLEEAARRVLGRRARVGKPLRMAGLPQNASGPAFAAAIGLCVYAATPAREAWDYDAPLAPSGRGRVARAMRWFKENW
jgi:cell division protein FtsA